MRDFTRHEELQRVLRAHVIAEFDEALVDDLCARLGSDIAPKVDIKLARDLEVVSGPRVAHGVEKVDAAASGNCDQRISFGRLAFEFHGFEVKAGQGSDDLEVTQLFRADIHQQIFARWVLAIEALNRILHGGRKFAVGTAELFQEHIAERGPARRRGPYT